MDGSKKTTLENWIDVGKERRWQIKDLIYLFPSLPIVSMMRLHLYFVVVTHFATPKRLQDKQKTRAPAFPFTTLLILPQPSKSHVFFYIANQGKDLRSLDLLPGRSENKTHRWNSHNENDSIYIYIYKIQFQYVVRENTVLKLRSPREALLNWKRTENNKENYSYLNELETSKQSRSEGN